MVRRQPEARAPPVLAQITGKKLLGEVPLDLEIRETSDCGTPITVSSPDNPHALVFRAMAARIWEKIAGAAIPGTARQG
jgi:ATP-binding protein involved in chromosome partitioning